MSVRRRNKSVTIKNRRQLVYAFVIFAVLMIALCFRVGWIQIVKGDEYSSMARAQQTQDDVVQAKRGAIVDRNNAPLAESTIKYSVWIRPASVNTSENKDKSVRDAENEKKMKNVCSKLATVLDMDADEIYDMVKGKTNVVKIAKYESAETADKIRDLDLTGVEITEQTKRYYPNGNFASQLLGSVTDDNVGLSGLELQYDSYLKGVDGRWIYRKDVLGNLLSGGSQKYEKPVEGDTVVTTVDGVIQQYAEKACSNVKKSAKAERVSCLVMDPQTGEILAAASNPGYDPNNPRTPVSASEKKKYNSLDDDQKLKYLQKMWRCPLFQDTYEPGSTFKLLTAAMALEENDANLTETWTCTGSITVDNVQLKCWNWRHPHGTQNLEEAVGNSCNPVFATLAMKIGAKTFYDYMGLFGITEKTGIDYPGEGQGLVMSLDTLESSKVNLATQGYGQGVSVTPVQLLTAICSIGNDGVMVQPHLVKEIKDSNGKTVKKFGTTKIRRVMSEDTANKMKDIMQYVVDKGGGEKAKIKGVKVGGKTGTAQVVVDGEYTDDVVASFVGMAPMDDPQIAVLFLVDKPADQSHGGTVAAPGAKYVIQNTLKYMNLASGN